MPESILRSRPGSTVSNRSRNVGAVRIPTISFLESWSCARCPVLHRMVTVVGA